MTSSINDVRLATFIPLVNKPNSLIINVVCRGIAAAQLVLPEGVTTRGGVKVCFVELFAVWVRLYSCYRRGDLYIIPRRAQLGEDW